MTTMQVNRARISEALARLIDQFRGQPIIGAFVAAWARQSQAVEATSFGLLEETWLATAIGVQLDGLGEIVGVERGGLSDTDYRLRIRAQVKRNVSSGTIDELLELCTDLGATSVVLTETPPAKIALDSQSIVVSGLQIGRLAASAKPAGVGFSFTWYESSTPFKFDTAGQGLDQGELGEMITV